MQCVVYGRLKGDRLDLIVSQSALIVVSSIPRDATQSTVLLRQVVCLSVRDVEVS